MSMLTCPLTTSFLLAEEMLKFCHDIFNKLSIFTINLFTLMILMYLVISVDNQQKHQIIQLFALLMGMG